MNSFDQIIKDLKNKVYSPVYFLQGEEAYYIDKISDYIEAHVLSDSEKEFNQTIVYGKDVDVLTLISHAKRYPMMSNYQVVMVKEAQDIRNLISKDDKDPLAEYIQQPLASTILVFCYKYKELDKRTRFAKVITKHATLFTSSKIYDNKIPEWVNQYVLSQAFRIDPRAAALIGEYLGNDLSKVSNELDKLMLNLKKGDVINVQHIEEFIGISKDYNIFEFQAALGKKNVLKANRIANYFAANRKNNPIVVTIPQLYSYFSRVLTYHAMQREHADNKAIAGEMGINPYFIKDYETAAKAYPSHQVIKIVGYLREYDLKSKGVDSSADEGELLKELVFKILH
jgi:DNA polymerase-3 subunit delta